MPARRSNTTKVNTESEEYIDEPQSLLEQIAENKENKELKLSLHRQKEADFLPEELFELTHLEELRLYSFSLDTIPSGILKLTNLKRLDIYRAKTTYFPLELSQLPNLGEFSIHSSELTEVPIETANWNKLYYLNVGDCPKLIAINGIPKGLTYIHIGGTGLGGIPNIIFSCTLLTKIVAIELELTSLPEALFTLPILTSLFISDNKFTRLPDELSRLTYLTEIVARRNQITEYPESLTKLQFLETVNLESNLLSDLPNSFANLSKLKELNLANNNFSSIPECIFNIQSLEELHLHNAPYKTDSSKNSITNLSEKILKLKKLNHFDIEGNPITNVPTEIITQGIEAIRSYFIQLQTQAQDYLFEAKLLILGEPASGKTSLTWKLENAGCELPQEEDTTKGIDVKEYYFPINDADLPAAIKGQKREFRLNIWDFGGQEIYKATHRFFLSNRALYILVSDTRKEDTDFNYWLHIVEIFGDQSPLLIILNEKSGRVHPVDAVGLQARFDNIRKILDVNLADSNMARLDVIKYFIQLFAVKLAHVGSVVPAKWTAVRAAIEADDRDIISVQDYIALCRQHGINKQEDALVLSQYFHDIGVFLHFQKDAVLKKSLFLNPTWATNAVYKVLDDDLLIQQNGRFSKADAEAIWCEEEFSLLHDELLKLMQNFFLTYQISDTDEYIVPDKLPANTPSYTWNKADNLIVEYHYKPFMPKGLLTQFIVKTHPFIVQHEMVWRRGVLLQWRNTFAEVTETYDTGTIRIRVSGKYKRDFMTILTTQLDMLSEPYRKLQIIKRIPCNCAECTTQQPPHFYDLDSLQRRIEKGQPTVQCDRSYDFVNVEGLLNEVFNVDSAFDNYVSAFATARDLKAVENSMITNKKVFISYAHANKRYLTRLLTHFKAIKHAGVEVDEWADTRLKAGSKWREDIEQAMQECRIAILLISTDFLASDFIMTNELPTLLAAAKKRGVDIIPLIVAPCDFTQSEGLSEYQSVNEPSKPLSSLTPAKRDEVYLAVTKRVRELLLPT